MTDHGITPVRDAIMAGDGRAVTWSRAMMRRPTGLPVQIGYASGNLGKSVVWTTFEIFLLFYLVTIAGLSPVLAGGILAAAMVWDGFADIVVGYMTDRHGRSGGRSGRAGGSARHLVVAAPLCGAAFCAIFLDPGADAGWGIAGIVAACLLCRCCYTLCDVAHNMLIVRVAPTPRDAATVSGLRLIFSAAGAALVGLTMASVDIAREMGGGGHGLALFAAIGGSLYAVMLGIAFATTRHLPSLAIRSHPVRVAQAASILWHDRTLRRLFALIAVQASLVPLFVKALPFYARTIEADPGWTGHALVIITTAQAASLPLWTVMARRSSSWGISSRGISQVGHGLMLVALALMAAAGGGLAETLGLAVTGVAQAGINLAIWAMLSTAVRDGDCRPAGLEALPVGVFLAVLKCAAGFGTGLLATMLWLAPRLGEEWGGASGLVTLMALAVPALGSMLCLLIHHRAGRG